MLSGKRQSSFEVKSKGEEMNEIRIGNFVVPDSSKFELAGENEQGRSDHRRSLYATIAALFVDSEGLLRYDFMAALTGVWPA